MNRNRSWTIVGIVLMTAFGSIAVAQQRKPERANVRCEGKIKALGRGLVHVVGEEGQQWLVAVEAKPQDISFQGTASPEFLRPGMLVQFRAALDKKGEASQPITELRVIAPREGIQLGLKQEGGFGGTELFASDDDAGGKKKKSQDEKLFLIAGTLRSVKDRKIQVLAAGATVKGELADNCSVTLDVSDYSLAREGDPITLQGWHFVGQPNQVHATQMTIIAEKPLVFADEAKKRRAPGKGGNKAAGDTGDKTAERKGEGEKGGAISDGEGNKKSQP